MKKRTTKKVTTKKPLPSRRIPSCLRREAVWRHVGGGCWVDPTMVQVKGYPCDDDYEHIRTGKIARLHTTMEAHFVMPQYLRSLRDVLQYVGVLRVVEEL